MEGLREAWRSTTDPQRNEPHPPARERNEVIASLPHSLGLTKTILMRFNFNERSGLWKADVDDDVPSLVVPSRLEVESNSPRRTGGLVKTKEAIRMRKRPRRHDASPFHLEILTILKKETSGKAKGLRRFYTDILG